MTLRYLQMAYPPPEISDVSDEHGKPDRLVLPRCLAPAYVICSLGPGKYSFAIAWAQARRREWSGSLDERILLSTDGTWII